MEYVGEEEIDHMFTDEVVCPHCGEEYQDSWELPDSDDRECYNCGEEFHFERNVEVTYSTYKKDE